MNKLLNYKKFYSIYRFLPLILAATILFLMFVWSIVDVAALGTHYTSTYGNRVDYYGVMRLKSAFLCLIIWWLIGIVLAAATWFFSALAVSPTITRTDAVIEMNERGKTN